VEQREKDCGHKKSNAKNCRTKGLQMANRDVALMIWGLPILGAVLSALGYWMVAHNLANPGVAVFVAAGCAFLLGLHTYIRYIYKGLTEFRKFPVIFGTSIISMSVGFAASAAYELLFPYPTVLVVTPSRSLSFAFHQGPRGPLSPMVFVVRSGQNVASSMNLLLYLTFQNISPHPKLIVGYGLEIAPDANGPWTRLCPVTITDVGKIYWINAVTDRLNMKEANELSNEDAIDRKIIEKPIPADGTVWGWTAWEFPQFRSYFPAYGKMAILLASGERQVQIISIKTESEATLSGAKLRSLSAHNDLSQTAELLPCVRAFALSP
jgi:hypothetical protein